MKPISEEKIREESSRGKNEPIAKSPRVIIKQNAEVETTEEAAKKQPGTDQAREEN
jgi:hypothetical protein